LPAGLKLHPLGNIILLPSGFGCACVRGIKQGRINSEKVVNPNNKIRQLFSESEEKYFMMNKL
jgi:hypothetical protein